MVRRQYSLFGIRRVSGSDESAGTPARLRAVENSEGSKPSKQPISYCSCPEIPPAHRDPIPPKPNISNAQSQVPAQKYD
jgi:hypothetical protein